MPWYRFKVEYCTSACVASLNGIVDVQSEIGYGTTVKIDVKLELPSERSNTVSTEGQALSQLHGHKAGLVGFDIYPNIRETPTGILSKQAAKSLTLKSSSVRAIKKGYGLETAVVTSIDSECADIDILLMAESHCQRTHSADSQPRQKPWIVLCSNLILDYRSVSHVNGPIVNLSQPYVNSFTLSPQSIF